MIWYGWLLNKYFILSKGNFNQHKSLKSPAMGYGNLSSGHQPIRTRQISLMCISYVKDYQHTKFELCRTQFKGQKT